MLKPLQTTDLRPSTQAISTIQAYQPSALIDGVRIEELKQFTDDGGALVELGRFTDGIHSQFPDFTIRQVNYSLVVPGAIKAFHLHLHQEDIWFVPSDQRLLVILADERIGSPSVGVMMRLVLGGGKARLLLIPRGVAHGASNQGQTSASIIYFVNQHFDREHPDEGRLPWDYLDTNIWEITKG